MKELNLCYVLVFTYVFVCASPEMLCSEPLKMPFPIYLAQISNIKVKPEYISLIPWQKC